MHIAISKRYLSLENEKHEMLKRLPTAAIPHYEIRDGNRVFVPGVLMDTTLGKMDEIIARNPVKEQPIPEQFLHERKPVDRYTERPAFVQEIRRPKAPVHDIEHER